MTFRMQFDVRLWNRDWFIPDRQLEKTYAKRAALLANTVTITAKKLEALLVQEFASFHYCSCIVDNLLSATEQSNTLARMASQKKGCYLWAFGDNTITIGHSVTDLYKEAVYKPNLNLQKFCRKSGWQNAVLFALVFKSEPSCTNEATAQVLALERLLIKKLEPLALEYQTEEQRTASARFEADHKLYLESMAELMIKAANKKKQEAINAEKKATALALNAPKLLEAPKIAEDNGVPKEIAQNKDEHGLKERVIKEATEAVEVFDQHPAAAKTMAYFEDKICALWPQEDYRLFAYDSVEIANDLATDNEYAAELKAATSGKLGCFVWLSDETVITIGYTWADLYQEGVLTPNQNCLDYCRQYNVEAPVVYFFVLDVPFRSANQARRKVKNLQKLLIKKLKPVKLEFYNQIQPSALAESSIASEIVEAPIFDRENGLQQSGSAPAFDTKIEPQTAKRKNLQPIKVTDTRTEQTFAFKSISAAVRSNLGLGSRPTVTKYLKSGALLKNTWLLEPII